MVNHRGVFKQLKGEVWTSVKDKSNNDSLLILLANSRIKANQISYDLKKTLLFKRAAHVSSGYKFNWS